MQVYHLPSLGENQRTISYIVGIRVVGGDSIDDILYKRNFVRHTTHAMVLGAIY